jgi:hypothetical protein
MKSQQNHHANGLISALLDSHAELGGRDDAAMDLGAYDDPQAFQALLTVASDPKEDEMLQDSCGESLKEICRRNANLDLSFVGKLTPAAKKYFVQS